MKPRSANSLSHISQRKHRGCQLAFMALMTLPITNSPKQLKSDFDTFNRIKLSIYDATNDIIKFYGINTNKQKEPTSFIHMK